MPARRLAVAVVAAAVTAALAGSSVAATLVPHAQRATASKAATRRQARAASGAAASPVVYSGPARREVALTFDDGWCRSCADGILKVLLRTGAHATICPNGAAGPAVWNHEAPLVRLLLRRRQLSLCDHTFTHVDALRVSDARLRDEILRDDRWMRREFGASSRPFFRPPYGAWNGRTVAVARAAGFPVVVLWSGTLADSSPHTVPYELDAIRHWARPGAIILGHANEPQTPRALPKMLALLAQMGLRPVTLAELLGPQARQRRSPRA